VINSMKMMTKIAMKCVDCTKTFTTYIRSTVRTRCVECEIVRLEEQRNGVRVPPPIGNQVISMFRKAKARGRIPES
jgi:hypothetical protein